MYVQYISHKHYYLHYLWFRIKICLSNPQFLSTAIIFCLPLHIRSMLLECRFLWLSSWSWWYFWFFIAFWHISTLKYNFSPVPEAELNEVVLQLHSVICVLTTTFMVYLWLGGYVFPYSSNGILVKFFINFIVLQIPCNFADLLSAIFFDK